jgi:hypothetical protein
MMDQAKFSKHQRIGQLLLNTFGFAGTLRR